MSERVLLIGGTGPTGVHVLRHLVESGREVTVLNRGRHQREETPTSVTRLVADPYSEESLAEALDGHTWDLIIASYGRLRRIAELTRGRTGRFIAITGVPVYRGWNNPDVFRPAGIPIPVGEGHERVDSEAEDTKGVRIAYSEDVVFDNHPTATIMRYPNVYGPHQQVPREWCIVRRVLDGRRRIILADGGATLTHQGFSRNVAHALCLVIDSPGISAGQVYHIADEDVLTVRQYVEVIAEALGHSFDYVSMPVELAVPARPYTGSPSGAHRFLDLQKIRTELGYRDVVPARTALQGAAHFWAEHPPGEESLVPARLQDPFDYVAEDLLVDSWTSALATMRPVEFDVEPGWGPEDSGPSGAPRASLSFQR